MESLEEVHNDKIPDENSKKRCIGMLDPDYLCSPDPKKLKKLQEEGQEELCSRVIRVVEKNFDDSIHEGFKELEEIDSRIVQIRQLLHTLRYCVLLNFYAMNKQTKKNSKDGFHELHPNIQRHLQKSSFKKESASSETTEVESNANKMEVTTAVKKEHPSQGEAPSQSSLFSKCSHETALGGAVKEPSHPSDLTLSQRGQNSEGDGPPKHVPKMVSTKSTCISQGRQSRFQSKKRVVVGNTYQYLFDESNSKEHSLRFKWRIYVRGPQDEPDISSFVSSVTFTLDKSYSPHDVITIKQPPFVLSRRGWGEFKVFLKVSFQSPLDKPIQLLHALTLGRVNDPLAFTGVWRLGKETWYDVRVQDKWDKGATLPKKDEVEVGTPPCDGLETPNSDSLTQTKANVEDFIKDGLDYSETEGHVTVSHAEVKTEQSLQAEALTQPVTTTNIQKLLNSSAQSNGERKMYKIQVRQADGKLVPYFIPSNMYDDALKLAEKAKIQKLKTETLQDASLKPQSLTNQTSNGHGPEPTVHKLKSPIKLKKAKILSKVPKNPSLKSVTSNTQPSLGIQPSQLHFTNGSNIIRPALQIPKGIVVKFNPNSTTSQSEGSTISLPTTATTVGSNSIRLTSSVLPANTAKFLKTIGGNRFLITSPLSAGDKLAADKKSIINGSLQNGMLTQSVLGPSAQGGGPLAGNKVIFAPLITSNSKANGNLPLNVKAFSPALSALSIGKNAGSPTRRIFISAPPHLVKLKSGSPHRPGSPSSLPVLASPSKARLKLEGKGEVETQAEKEILVTYANRLGTLRDLSSKCHSVEEVLRLYMKGLPICRDLDPSDSPCFAASSVQFLNWPAGKQKAIEFWRSRRIREQLKELDLPGWRSWNSLRIASWARRHCFTPFPRKPHLLSEQHVRKVQLPRVQLESSTLTISIDPHSPTKGKKGALAPHTELAPVEILIDDQNEESKQGQPQKNGVSEPCELLPLPDSMEGPSFVSSTAARIRMPLHPEMVEPGVKMDLANAVLWKATLSFMEDLLRSSHSAAYTTLAESNLSKAASDSLSAPIHDSYVTPPCAIDVGHVKAGLVYSRPEFQMFTNFGLGKMVQDTWKLDLKRIKDEED